MAYADANTNSHKLTAGVAVIALEAGLAWAIIAGLTFTVTRIKDTHIAAFPVPKITPEPPVAPPPDQTHHVTKQWTVTPEPVRPLHSENPDRFTSSEPATDTGGIIRDYTFPTGEPSAKPAFKPKVARPKGDSSRWLSADDYPRRGLINQHEGQVGYRLSVDSSGRVTSCSVTRSSGHSELDDATCQLLPRRAGFEPARDDTGAAISGSYTGSVTWRLPPDE